MSRPSRLPRSLSHIIVAVVYYPPQSPVSDRLLDYINETTDKLLSSHPDAGITIVGDFNQLNLSQLLTDTRFKQVVNQPTRDNRILDKIFSNLSYLYAEPVIKSPIASSNHSTIVWSPLLTYHHSKNITKSRTTRPLRDSDVHRFGTWICHYDWAPVMQVKDPNEQCDVFYKALNSAINYHFPPLNYMSWPSGLVHWTQVLVLSECGFESRTGRLRRLCP